MEIKQGLEVTFKHSGNAGDIIAAMAGIKAVCEKMGAKARIYLRLNTPAHYYAGAPKHPVQDGKGSEVLLSRGMYNMLKPLLEAQDYVAGVEIYTGQVVVVDLDKVRGEINVGIPHTQIQHWYGFAFPDMWADISEKWICREGGRTETYDKILINRTSRYLNDYIDFHFLKPWAERGEIIFTGLPEERDIFCEQNGLDIPLLEVKDFLDLAGHLASARMVLCNQSFVYNLCEAMKVPRILEICPWAANCTPVGESGKGYMHQGGLEYWFDEMTK